jgi:hypothetical protein
VQFTPHAYMRIQILKNGEKQREKEKKKKVSVVWFVWPFLGNFSPLRLDLRITQVNLLYARRSCA